jgi:hypothetical protein
MPKQTFKTELKFSKSDRRELKIVIQVTWQRYVMTKKELKLW